MQRSRRKPSSSPPPWNVVFGTQPQPPAVLSSTPPPSPRPPRPPSPTSDPFGLDRSNILLHTFRFDNSTLRIIVAYPIPLL
ncbi:hypothetical protein ABKN59_011733 [Abortiporus biennis]